MPGATVGAVVRPGSDAVAVAVTSVAEVRAALGDFGTALLGSSGVEARSGMFRPPPIAAPLPDVPRAVVKPVAIGFESVYGSCA